MHNSMHRIELVVGMVGEEIGVWMRYIKCGRQRDRPRMNEWVSKEHWWEEKSTSV